MCKKIKLNEKHNFGARESVPGSSELTVNPGHSWPLEHLVCAGHSHNWNWSGSNDLLKTHSDLWQATSSRSVAQHALQCFHFWCREIAARVAGACAAEIVVGELVNVTCFIALAEERP